MKSILNYNKCDFKLQGVRSFICIRDLIKSKLLQKKVKASFTIEAAIVLPTILFVLIGIIYLTFYLHDKVKLENGVYDILQKERDYILYEISSDSGMDKEEYLKRSVFSGLFNGVQKSYLQQDISSYKQDNLLISEVKEIMVKRESNHMNLQITIHINIPGNHIKKFFTGSGFTYTYQNQISLEKAADYVNLFDVTYGVISKIEGVQKGLEALKGVCGSYDAD